MRNIIRIMKTELRVLFYSPIAWLILIVFAFQSGYEIFNIYNTQLKYEMMGIDLYSLSKSMLAGMGGLFSLMLRHLYLYIPLLTMSLMSRELSSGSIKLLYSSPVSDFQMVMGKYFSVLVYGLMLIGILGVISIFTLSTIVSPDIPMVLVGLLGVYLTIAVYGAIGLFMSTITRYQVVAVISTLVILTILNFIGGVGQEYDFVRDLTYWLSIQGRSSVFLDGMISSSDLLYFVLVIALFLSLSWIKLTGERASRTKAGSILRYSGVIFATLLIGYVTSLPKMIKYYDATATKSNTLTEESQAIIAQLEGDLTITTYVNILETNYHKGMPSNINNDKTRFKQYIGFKPEIKQKYVYYYDTGYYPYLDTRYAGLSNYERMLELCKLSDYNPKMFLSPEEVKKQVDLSGENNRFVRVLERGNGDRQFLRIFNDRRTDPSEPEISSVLKKFVVKSPLVGFVTGHQERSIKDMSPRGYQQFADEKTFRYSLINQGFDIMEINLGSEIPSTVDILILSDMRAPLTSEEMCNFKKYVDRGGNLVILGEVKRQQNMNPIVELFGVRFGNEMLVEPTNSYLDDLVIGHFTDEAAHNFAGFNSLKIGAYCITTPTTCSIEDIDDKGFKSITILTTKGDRVWNEKTTTDFVNEKSNYNPELGEVKKEYSLMKYLTRDVNSKEQRVFIIADSDCISAEELSMERAGIKSYNFGLLNTVFRNLSYEQFPVSARRVRPPDDKLRITSSGLKIAKVVIMWIIPIILLLSYILLWWKRRGR